MEAGCFEVRAAENGGEVKLAMQRLWLAGQILPVGARLFVRHVFRNGEDRNLEVIYGFMLPRDAALRGFEVTGDGFEAYSELKRIEEDVKQYEEGIEAGHLSTLARAYRDGVVNLSLGNLKKSEQVTVTMEIMAGVELRDDGLRFRFPFTLAPGYHRQMQVMDMGGTLEIELPSKSFGDMIMPPLNKGSDGLHEVGFDVDIRVAGRIAEIGSPSHAIRVRENAAGAVDGTRRVSLAPEADFPNRDLVLDVKVAEPRTQAFAGVGHFAMVIPSTEFGAAASTPRKVALVIDRSGSMQGKPMEQARRAVDACLGALSFDDEFAIVAFDSIVESFRPQAVKATLENRRDAQSYLNGVDARGGTELAAGFSAGAAMVAGGGDVLVITDGQVMGTEEILAVARDRGVRIHCLGIGSASQDRFLSQLAKSTGGVSRFVTPAERVDVAAVDLFASIGRPVASGVTAAGAEFATKPADYVFAGTPWVVFGEAIPGNTVELTWADRKLTAVVPADDSGDVIRLLDGARRIADLESRMTQGLETELTGTLAGLSERFGLASRAMSLVAVVKRMSDIAGNLPDTRVVAVGMPQFTQYEAYAPRRSMMAPPPSPPMAAAGLYDRSQAQYSVGQAKARKRSIGEHLMAAGAVVRECMKLPAHASGAPVPARAATPHQQELAEGTVTDQLLDISANLDPDGGVHGNPDDRALKTISAVLLFLSEGHTLTTGAFRAHVERLVRFLETLTGLSDTHKDVANRVAAFARAENTPRQSHVPTWEDVEAAIG